MPDLLLELLSEEIPARMQPRAAEDLRRLVTGGLVDRGISYAHAAAFATPRRLALAVSGLADRSPTLTEERRGPRVDAPAKAIEGFLRATGLSRDDLAVKPDRKGDVYVATLTTPGRPAAAVVAEVVEEVVRGFPWPKSMRWGAGSLRWVRPLRRILCLLSTEAGAETVPLVIDGIAAGDLTEGHPFMAPGTIRVSSHDDYRAKLRTARVLLDPEERAATILHDATQAAFARGLALVEDRGLLVEIAGLVEWPVVLTGRIEDRFRDLPPEVLITSMKTHQKFLSLRNPANGRVEGYVVVANRETADGGATILAGNARVLAARLSDAAFFWDNDLRVARAGMGAWLDRLQAVTFHNRLGSQADRIGRIAALARVLAPAVGADPDLAEQAARLAKADLASEMVYEFPELQGVMGCYYARAAGAPPEVAAACRDHYAPLGPSDAVPAAPISIAVALADKIDMLAGFWAIDEKPTGSKDPFALRRAALGVIRIVLENGLRLRLLPVIAAARPDLDPADLLAFLADRLTVALRDQGIRHDVIQACFALGGQDDLVALVARVRALEDFLATEDGANLLAGYTRAVSILAAEERKDGNIDYSGEPLPDLAETEAECALFAALDTAEAALGPALDAEAFAAAMTALAGLRAPIDAFFETTIVNADSPILRRNRLCLLNRIRQVMARVADFGVITG